MVIGSVVNVSTEYLPEVLLAAGRIAQGLQALGIIILLWLGFQIVNFILHRKRTNAVYDFKKDISEIKLKLNKIERLIKKQKK